jgi:hypothetical protein
VFVLTATLLIAAHPAAAQSFDDRAENLLANAAIGVATGGLRAVIQRKPVRPALLRGAVGGSLLSAGKQVAGRGYAATGMAGRVITSLGIAAFTAESRDSLAFRLPIGPLTLELRPGATDRLRTRVNVWTAVVLATALADSDSHFDMRASLDAGAPVFTRPAHRMSGHDLKAGFAHPGVIILNRDAELFGIDRREVLAHEAIHVLQWDAYHALVTLPVERAALRRLTRSDRFNRRFELNVLAPLTVAGVAELIPEERDRPWEREAYRLTRPIDLNGGLSTLTRR